MSIVKSFSVANGDMFYIQHNSDNFTIIDCNLNADTVEERIKDLKKASQGKGITRFISTHPDQDHIGGIELLDAKMPISNFYVVKNGAIKPEETESFKHYCKLRDDAEKAYYIQKGSTRKWMNIGDEKRDNSGISILWPDVKNADFQEALEESNAGKSYNNISSIIRYKLADGASFLWLGDLETDFMEKITDHVDLTKTTVVFAPHHGRKSGKIPESWLKKLDPQLIVVGEAPSQHLNYYSGYKTITQNSAGDITMECVGDKVHFYVSEPGYSHNGLVNENMNTFDNYIGSLTVKGEQAEAMKEAA
ncbi:ComEC/Rec2 family competence protein [Duganella sp. Root1480D1]|uniref:ComEC/Rec2 family competence protein n=1 Tax=Duganella sp. Root1480D1 TaxID=1736471 RepID=UPI00070D01DF|nr:hypothetical protein [Duganella sp. Root1480D1]KQZ35117.1 hypothetical protein ASD58_28295 [Duganella sp. Root1480D1]